MRRYAISPHDQYQRHFGFWLRLWPQLTDQQRRTIDQARYDEICWIEFRKHPDTNLPPRQLWHEWRQRRGVA